MAPLESLVQAALVHLIEGGAKLTVTSSDCQLLLNNKALDLKTPTRFANIPTGAKLKLITGAPGQPVLVVGCQAYRAASRSNRERRFLTTSVCQRRARASAGSPTVCASDCQGPACRGWQPACSSAESCSGRRHPVLWGKAPCLSGRSGTCRRRLSPGGQQGGGGAGTAASSHAGRGPAGPAGGHLRAQGAPVHQGGRGAGAGSQASRGSRSSLAEGRARRCAAPCQPALDPGNRCARDTTSGEMAAFAGPSRLPSPLAQTSRRSTMNSPRQTIGGWRRA